MCTRVQVNQILEDFVMELVFEVLMILSLCIAAGIQLYRFAVGKTVHTAVERAAVITMGLGFVMGTAWKLMEQPMSWLFVLYLLGAFLCYSAVLFSFPGKEGRHE